ncbi:MAG: HD-GYP domain-containing protein [bacterium]
MNHATPNSGRTEIEIEYLMPGMVLASDIFDGDNVLLRSGTAVTQEFLNSLKRRGVEKIVVSDAVAADIKVQQSTMMGGETAARPALDIPEHLETELAANERDILSSAGVETAVEEQLLLETSECVEDVFSRLNEGNLESLNALKGPVSEMIKQSVSKPHAAVKLLDVEHFDQYTFRHSVNVGLIFFTVAKSHFPAEELEELMLGAILHDVGKVKIPREIIQKEGPLTREEFALMKKHPEYGVEMLKDYPGLSEKALDIVLSHHERWDGRGYPNGLLEDEITWIAQIAMVCDVYDALTTTRSYKAKMDFHAAMSIIVQGSGSHFSKKSVRALCTTLGLYPLGTFVLLSDRTVAVVKQVNEDALARPIVTVIYNEDGTKLPAPRDLNLAITPDLSIIRPITVHKLGAH